MMINGSMEEVKEKKHIYVRYCWGMHASCSEMTMHRLQAVTSLVTRATFHAQAQPRLSFFFLIIVYPFH